MTWSKPLEHRVAFVITQEKQDDKGFDFCKEVGKDGKEAAKLLMKCGFHTHQLTNVDKEMFDRLGNELFPQSLQGKPKAVFLLYYAGHGFSWNGVNYLVPKGARVDDPKTWVKLNSLLQRVHDVSGGRPSQMQDVADQCNTMPAKESILLVVLDCCRQGPKNPASKCLPSKCLPLLSCSRPFVWEPDRLTAATRRYHLVNTEVHFLYSCDDGAPATDGHFGAAFRHALEQEGLCWHALVEECQERCRQLSGGRQRSWHYGCGTRASQLVLHRMKSSMRPRGITVVPPVESPTASEWQTDVFPQLPEKLGSNSLRSMPSLRLAFLIDQQPFIDPNNNPLAELDCHLRVCNFQVTHHSAADKATFLQLRNTLKASLSIRENEEAIFLLYYIGPARNCKGQTFFLPIDSDEDDPFTWISLHDLLLPTQEVTCKVSLLVLIDAGREMSGADRVDVCNHMDPDACVIYAARNAKDFAQGRFTRAFTEALRECPNEPFIRVWQTCTEVCQKQEGSLKPQKPYMVDGISGLLDVVLHPTEEAQPENQWSSSVLHMLSCFGWRT